MLILAELTQTKTKLKSLQKSIKLSKGLGTVPTNRVIDPGDTHSKSCTAYVICWLRKRNTSGRKFASTYKSKKIGKHKKQYKAMF